MKSLFARNFLIYALVIVLGFTVLGSAFIYQVNPNTVQKALVLLEEEGLLETFGTAGRTVTSDIQKITESKCRENAGMTVPACGLYLN